jgi:DNA-binding transcriptional LysR family regulator
MRLEWLEDICAVTETGSFTEAAERRHLTQSAFSRRIKSIEDYLGVPLFDRNHKPITLTSTLLDHNDRIAQIAQDLRHLISDLQLGEKRSSKRVVLASLHSLTTSVTPSFIEKVQKHDSDIYISLRSANMDECFSLLLSRQADIAFVYLIPQNELLIDAANLQSTPVGMERFIPVIANTQKKYLTDQIKRGALPLIAYPSRVFLGKVMARHIIPQLHDIKYVMPKAETALTLAALELAMLGIGVCWVPASLAKSRIEDGKLADLSDILPSCELCVTAVRVLGKMTPVATEVWERLQDWAGSQIENGSATSSASDASQSWA